MSDAARRVLTDEGRARIQDARTRGEVCALCGRELAADEAIWIERVAVNPTGSIRWLAPLGRECATSAFVRETEGKDPESCVACGRGMYSQSPDPRRAEVLCSRRCAARRQKARQAGKRA